MKNGLRHLAHRWFGVFSSDGSQRAGNRWDVIYCFILTWIILFCIKLFKSRPHYSNQNLLIPKQNSRIIFNVLFFFFVFSSCKNCRSNARTHNKIKTDIQTTQTEYERWLSNLTIEIAFCVHINNSPSKMIWLYIWFRAVCIFNVFFSLQFLLFLQCMPNNLVHCLECQRTIWQKCPFDSHYNFFLLFSCVARVLVPPCNVYNFVYLKRKEGKYIVAYKILSFIFFIYL